MPHTLPPNPSPLSDDIRTFAPDGRRRDTRLPRSSIIPLTERGESGKPARTLRFGPDSKSQGSFAAGVALLSEVALKYPVHLVRRKAPWEIKGNALDYIISRMEFDRITERHLVPGVTLYASRCLHEGRDTLIIVDAVGPEWRQA